MGDRGTGRQGDERGHGDSGERHRGQMGYRPGDRVIGGGQGDRWGQGTRGDKRET